MWFFAQGGVRLPVFGRGLMGAALGVEAGVSEHEPLDGAAVEEVFVDDLLHIFYIDRAVPDGVGIDHDDGAVFTVVEATKLVGPDFALQTGVLDGVLECPLQLLTALAATAWPGGVLFPLIGADE
jgi:hypothetical protein